MKQIIMLLAVSVVTNVSDQRGENEFKTFNLSEVVNAYTAISSYFSIGFTTISVINSNLNNNFSSNLSPGDLIMIIQRGINE
jgi:hypothetical protein